jgi:hypothetical protein
MFGKWKERHMLRICFPARCFGEEEPTAISDEEQDEFYQKGLLPAMKAISPEIATEWPSSVSTEMFRARKRTGAFALQTKVVSFYDCRVLGTTLREKLTQANVEWAKGFFFAYQIRGTKHATTHGMDNRAAMMGLQELVRDSSIPLLQMTREARSSWWIDVGLEISSNTACLQWRTDSHFHVIQHVLNIDAHEANRITSLGSSKYERDLTAHLSGVSGCRITPGIQARGPFEVAYAQMYTTDKAITYCPEGQHKGKTLDGRDAVGATIPPSFCSGLYNVYAYATATNSSKARIELRVPFSFALDVLIDFPDAIIRNSLLAFTPNVWW